MPAVHQQACPGCARHGAQLRKQSFDLVFAEFRFAELHEAQSPGQCGLQAPEKFVDAEGPRALRAYFTRQSSERSSQPHLEV